MRETNNLTHICGTNSKNYEITFVGSNDYMFQQICCQTVTGIQFVLWLQRCTHMLCCLSKMDRNFLKHRINCTLLMKLEKNTTDIFIMSCKFVGKKVITSNEISVCLATSGEWQGGKCFLIGNLEDCTTTYKDRNCKLWRCRCVPKMIPKNLSNWQQMRKTFALNSQLH